MVILLRGIWMFNKFDLIWLLTKGGPLNQTETLPTLAYRKSFLESIKDYLFASSDEKDTKN